MKIYFKSDKLNGEEKENWIKTDEIHVIMKKYALGNSG